MFAMLDPGLFIFAMTVLGLLIGSFLNVVVHRLPLIMELEWHNECQQILGEATSQAPALSLARPRSRCPHCETPIRALDNIPVISYLLLGGRCRQCSTSISPRYPIVEAIAGALGGYAAWHFAATDEILSGPDMFMALAAAVYVWTLLALALIDFDTKLLPDTITMPLLWLGLALTLFGILPQNLDAAVLGAILGYMSLWSIYWAFKLLTGKEGMGYGDFKLLAALGAWLGWQPLPSVILLSSAVGALIGLLMLAGGRVKRADHIPFGPYLAAAGVIMMFWREPLDAFFRSGPIL